MKIKEILAMEKRNLPPYQYKYSYYFVLPFVISAFLSAIIVTLLVGYLEEINGDIFTTYLPLIVWIVLEAVGITVLIVWGNKVKKRIIFEHSATLSSLCEPIAETEYQSVLQQKGIATAEGFYIYDIENLDYSTDNPLPFDESRSILPLRDTLLIFYARYFAGVMFVQIAVIDQKTGNLVSAPVMSGEVYNYVSAHNFQFLNEQVYNLFLTDKEAFMGYLLRYVDTNTMSQKLFEKNTSPNNK